MRNELDSFLEKPLVQKSLFVLFALAIIIFFFEHYLTHKTVSIDPKNLISCHKTLKTHAVQITKTGFQPSKITAQACDELIFLNNSGRIYKIAFGEHSQHIVYPGFKEYIIRPGDKNSLLLSAVGSYRFHDHFKAEIKGELEILKN